ncbi:MAG: phosphate signaling complex protein PhoU [Desulfobacterales bacterium]|nr:phosphate signaling complex protein PhoU [Desulfobacterales bacterium]MBF0396400.1 phosphate signaling complex protein PhoU [Desulfobacterales bacterium]
MLKRLHKELNKIRKEILSLGAMVEDRIRLSISAIESKSEEISEQIIKTDYEIDSKEIEIEEECLKVLALHQPVAVDLRFLISVIKINNELERIADMAVNIAQRVIVIAKKKAIPFVFDYSKMGEKASYMLKNSLDALVNLDSDLALRVCAMDNEVDQLKNEAYDVIKEAIRTHAENVGFFINMLLISRHLERVADHATNIAEEVIYLVQGEIVRHGRYHF